MIRRGSIALLLLAALVLAGASETSQTSELKRQVRAAEEKQAQGRYAEAEAHLDQALVLARRSGDERRIAGVLGALGNVHVAMGADARAEQELLDAAQQARKTGAVRLAASLGNNLGNYFTLRTEGERDEDQRGEWSARAGDAYRQALTDARSAKDPGLTARILANHARLDLTRGDAQTARELLGEARASIETLEPSPENVLTRVHVGRSYQLLIEASQAPEEESVRAAHEVLTRAHADAQKIDDARGAAWAQGTLSAVYAQRGHDEEALLLARRALFDAQRASATEAELRFLIESARLLVKLGRRSEAIEAYRVAVDRLAEVRPALRVAYARADGSLHVAMAQAYREMVDLLLSRASTNEASAATDMQLAQALMERFKADELRDYFQDDCVDAWQERVTGATDPSLGAIVVYPVILEDRLEILVTRDGHMRQYTVPISREEVEEQTHQLRGFLEKRITRQYLPHSQRVYDWLVRPYEAELAASEGATLILVPDGVLRVIPIGALHDGERFLIERQPVATTPSLELSDPRPFDRARANVLLGGLSESVQGFAALPRVREELAAIGALYSSDALVDEAFVTKAISSRIREQPYAVVHLASHGQLGATVEESFLLTHDGRLAISELSANLSSTRFRDQPVEIITLSACDTAAGDERAALGLSGLAVRAGARSALGTLWLVNDVAASQLMVAFYTELAKPGVSRAKALQRAQLGLLQDSRYGHPGYWAPFLIISNWL